MELQEEKMIIRVRRVILASLITGKGKKPFCFNFFLPINSRIKMSVNYSF